MLGIVASGHSSVARRSAGGGSSLVTQPTDGQSTCWPQPEHLSSRRGWTKHVCLVLVPRLTQRQPNNVQLERELGLRLELVDNTKIHEPQQSSAGSVSQRVPALL
jgi:hypothetical protein